MEQTKNSDAYFNPANFTTFLPTVIQGKQSRVQQSPCGTVVHAIIVGTITRVNGQVESVIDGNRHGHCFMVCF